MKVSGKNVYDTFANITHFDLSEFYASESSDTFMLLSLFNHFLVAACLGET